MAKAAMKDGAWHKRLYTAEYSSHSQTTEKAGKQSNAIKASLLSVGRIRTRASRRSRNRLVVAVKKPVESRQDEQGQDRGGNDPADDHRG